MPAGHDTEFHGTERKRWARPPRSKRKSTMFQVNMPARGASIMDERRFPRSKNKDWLRRVRERPIFAGFVIIVCVAAAFIYYYGFV